MNRKFKLLIVTRFLFVLGVQIQAVLMGWQMYDLSHDPLQIGLIGLTEAIPALTIALFAGWLVDQFNPFRFYQVTLLVSIASMYLSSIAHAPNLLFMAAFLTGVARSFTGPATNSIIPRVVARGELKRSSAFTTVAFKLGSVIGPGLAGVLLAAQGYLLPYRVAQAFLVLGSICLLFVKYEHKKIVHTKTPSFYSDIKEGVHYVFKHPLLLSVMSLDMFAVLFGGVVAMLPIYAAEILHMGPEGLGWLRAAPSFGAIIMSIYLIRKPITQHAGKSLLWSVLGFGICIIVFGISKNFWLSFIVLATSGALDSVSMVIRTSIVQLCSPEHMRGRIASVNSMFIGSSNEIGQFESGVAAKLLGTVPSVIFGGVMTIFTVAIVFFRSKKLRNLDLNEI